MIEPSDDINVLSGSNQSPSELCQLLADVQFSMSPADESPSCIRNPDRASEERDLSGWKSQYIGASSGIAFLARVKRRLHKASVLDGNGSVLAFGDLAPPKVDSSFLNLPSRVEARNLLDVYFDYALPTHRFLHKPTAQAWLEILYDTQGEAELPSATRERNALILIALAHAKLYASGQSKRHDELLG